MTASQKDAAGHYQWAVAPASTLFAKLYVTSGCGECSRTSRAAIASSKDAPESVLRSLSLGSGRVVTAGTDGEDVRRGEGGASREEDQESAGDTTSKCAKDSLCCASIDRSSKRHEC